MGWSFASIPSGIFTSRSATKTSSSPMSSIIVPLNGSKYVSKNSKKFPIFKLNIYNFSIAYFDLFTVIICAPKIQFELSSNSFPVQNFADSSSRSADSGFRLYLRHDGSISQFVAAYQFDNFAVTKEFDQQGSS